MEHLMQEANSFSKINWACVVTLNPFVAFGVYLVDNCILIYLKKKVIDLSMFFVWKCAWWGNAENGVGGKKWNFSFWTALNWSKCIPMVSLYIWLSIYTNNQIPCIIWKFDLSSWGVLGSIYTLSIEVLRLLLLIAKEITILRGHFRTCTY